MSDDRAAIYRRLRAACPDPPLSQREPARPPAQPPTTAMTPAMLQRMARALERLGCTWELAESPITARLQLVARLQAEEVDRLLTWTADQLPVEGILETLAVLNVSLLELDLRAQMRPVRPQDHDQRSEVLGIAARVNVGLVAAEAGLAETGTLVLRGGPGRSLLAAQLPRRLIVLLPVSRLFARAGSWMAANRGREDDSEPGTVAFTSGPSRSLDLELLPALGIHGPRQMHIIAINGI